MLPLFTPLCRCVEVAIFDLVPVWSSTTFTVQLSLFVPSETENNYSSVSLLLSFLVCVVLSLASLVSLVRAVLFGNRCSSPFSSVRALLAGSGCVGLRRWVVAASRGLRLLWVPSGGADTLRRSAGRVPPWCGCCTVLSSVVGWWLHRAGSSCSGFRRRVESTPCGVPAGPGSAVVCPSSGGCCTLRTPAAPGSVLGWLPAAVPCGLRRQVLLPSRLLCAAGC